MAKIGYARVSTRDQDVSNQKTALTADGCERVFTETGTGLRDDRPELAKALDYVRTGDTLVVARLDRLGRSLPHLRRVLADLDGRGVGFRSLAESIDTTTAAGKLLLNVLGAIAEFEGDLRRERQQAAWSNGKTKGRKPRLSAAQVEEARAMWERGASAAKIAEVLGCSRSIAWRAATSQGQGAA
jgi:DNA invertase Pin-like site-specific DNA recombinase